MSDRLWFMDVDGVMAPFSHGGSFGDWERSEHPRYELWLSATQAERIQTILSETGTELIWVSTWAHDAAEYVESFLGWPTYEYAPLPHARASGGGLGPSGRWWKLEAVEGFLAARRPARFVWSDDDHPWHREAVRSSLTGFEAQGLLQVPDPMVGLTEKELDHAHEHLSR